MEYIGNTYDKSSLGEKTGECPTEATTDNICAVDFCAGNTGNCLANMCNAESSNCYFNYKS